MSKTASNTPALIEAPVNETALIRLSTARGELDVITAQDQSELNLLAISLGYEGSLSVGAIEDEIRFFQQRTVECLLETGKRLILLKQMTCHGNSSQIGTNSSHCETNSNFDTRVELLGISRATAYRFMSAAKKAGKSATVALLSGRAKNQKAFLELITHDDDVIDNLAEMDNFDRMSASQLREAARQLKKDSEFEASKRQKAEGERDGFEKKLRGNRPVMVPLDVRLEPFQQEIKDCQKLLEKCLMAQHQAVAALDSWHTTEVTAQPDYDPERYAPLPPAGITVLMDLVSHAERTASLVGALQARLDELWGGDIAVARQYLMRETGSAGADGE
jgi:DNA invertase Pin-like site-specific DNA recombinase